jgi:TusA-related sulfurtransferase
MKTAEREFLDCKGLCCPMPIVNIGRKLKSMEVGQEVDVEADDLAFEADVIAFTEQMKQTIVSLERGKIVKVCIRKDQ